jgi:NAD(P)-dependent dehydrogenase (short-subunit alcohol dehydrogenase family)
MARVLVTGSTDGLGLATGQLLISQGHAVTLHARNDDRAHDAQRVAPHAEHVLIGDAADLSGMKSVAEQANAVGRYDAIIHNVGVGYREPRRETEDGFSRLFAVNVLAPYVLTALINPPNRLVYLSSGMHLGGNPDLSDLQWTRRKWNGSQAYSDTKLFDVVLAFAVGRHWPSVLSNAVNPGWVPTKMGGPGAPDDLSSGADTQAWLAVSDDPSAAVSSEYFFHRQPDQVNAKARDAKLQEQFLSVCAELTQVHLP